MINDKVKNLKENLISRKRIAIAFSGGVDSTLLLRLAHDALKEGVLAITACSAAVPRRELAEAEAFCRQEGIRQVIFDADGLQAECFAQNPPNRCYHCKKAMFTRILEIAGEYGIDCVAEGSNMDDMEDFRPGLAAVQELGIISPLKEAGLYKEEIRALSGELGLATADKPSYACLASRFVYGEPITREKLAMVEAAEDFLISCGFTQMRVRVHGTLARIEVLPEEIVRLAEPKLRGAVEAKLRDCGFAYVAMDMKGYRSGSMNEMEVEGHGAGQIV